MNTRLFLTISLFSVGLLGLTGCIGSTTSETTIEGTNKPSTSAPAQESTVLTKQFGESYRFDDGMQLTVGPGVAFTPSEWASFGTEGANAYLRFTVTVVNGTEQTFDPSMIYMTMQSANTEAQEVYDSDNGLGFAPSTSLLPGREVVYDVGFAVADPNDLVMEASIGFSYKPVFYTN